ncbi:MAG: sigma-70 family RNA polymerase sigma factor [Bacteroidota bacterium]
MTTLLGEARAGDRAAFDRLLPLVYDELRLIAHRRLAGERAQTLSTTGLVHDAYLRLLDGADVAWADRAHFYAVASRAMRYVLVDHVRARQAQKRGGKDDPVPLDDVQVAAFANGGAGPEADERAADVLALHDALDRLGARSARLAETVELRFFGGLTHDEIADLTRRSVPTVKRDWAKARAWLHQYLDA